MEIESYDTVKAHSKTRLIIVSNRLPVVLHKNQDGTWTATSGSGGLVTALAPVLRDRGGLWIGWPGTYETDLPRIEAALSRNTKQAGFNFKPVTLTEEEIKKYYRGFSNEVLWPLFHDLVSRCRFDPGYWECYQEVNRKFARVIKEHQSGSDFIWVHDYHLINLAKELRDLGLDQKIGFFLHIPFPPLDVYLRLPWRFQILEHLMQYDLLGFQTLRDRNNFLQCARRLIRNVYIEGKGQVVTLKAKDRDIRVGAFPISIDYREFADLAATEDVASRAWVIHERLPNQQIILGVDRLDYTKGLPERLEAFRNTLRRYPELQEKVVYVQVVVPSRHEIPEYMELKKETERLVGEINGEFTRLGWVPIHYMFRSLSRPELVAYYRTAEIALVTPIKDGMNLIAKEYCTCSLEENCVLILSEFAGAASQLQKGALMVNPHDREGVAEAIYRAFKMPWKERQQRMRRLRASVRRQDIYWWVNTFLEAAIARRLDHFPILESYLPQMNDE